MNNVDNKFKTTDIVTNKQYRAIIILVFYFFFFLFLVVIARGITENKEVNNEKKDEHIKEASKVTGFSNIKKKNFNYKYTLTINDKVYIYNGEKYDNKDRFTITIGKEVKKYVQIDDFSFEIKNNEQVLTDKPIYFLDFFDVDIIEDIIANSTSNNNIYSITNRRLDNVLDLQFEADDNLDNNIILWYQDNTINRIDINYTNYIKFNNKNINKVLLTLEYNNFGSVEEFDIKDNNF